MKPNSHAVSGQLKASMLIPCQDDKVALSLMALKNDFKNLEESSYVSHLWNYPGSRLVDGKCVMNLLRRCARAT